MRQGRQSIALLASLAVALLAGPARTQPPPSAPPQIPGITAKDAFPRACVDCHAAYATHRFPALAGTAVAPQPAHGHEPHEH